MTDPAESVVWMVRGAWVTMSLRAGCLLGLFDRLDEPLSAGELAELTASHEGAVARLLLVLADLGLVETQRDGRYLNTATGEVLRADHTSGVRNLALMQSWLPNIACWAHLADAVRDGGSVYERVNGLPMWEHLGAHPDVEALFNGAMARRSAAQLAALADVDLAGVDTVVDVGGGRGAMLAGLLTAWPQLTGVVADRPEVAAEADAAFVEAGLSARARGVGADFFLGVPSGADLYLVSNVLHDWDDDDCIRILTTVRAAMDPGARLLIIERVLDAPGRGFEDSRDVHLVDLHMLVSFGARERTHAEYDALLVAAGLPPGVLHGTGTSWNVIEARHGPEAVDVPPE